jgi:hypothetical protein
MGRNISSSVEILVAVVTPAAIPEMNSTNTGHFNLYNHVLQFFSQFEIVIPFVVCV